MNKYYLGSWYIAPPWWKNFYYHAQTRCKYKPSIPDLNKVLKESWNMRVHESWLEYAHEDDLAAFILTYS